MTRIPIQLGSTVTGRRFLRSLAGRTPVDVPVSSALEAAAHAIVSRVDDALFDNPQGSNGADDGLLDDRTGEWESRLLQSPEFEAWRDGNSEVIPIDRNLDRSDLEESRSWEMGPVSATWAISADSALEPLVAQYRQKLSRASWGHPEPLTGDVITITSAADWSELVRRAPSALPADWKDYWVTWAPRWGARPDEPLVVPSWAALREQGVSAVTLTALAFAHLEGEAVRSELGVHPIVGWLPGGTLLLAE